MNIRIIAVGKLKEEYMQAACKEYEKRLSRYCKIEVIEVADERAPESLSKKQMEQVKEKEAEKVCRHIKDGILCCLDIKGKTQDSMQFASMIEEFEHSGKTNINFVIGGSLGIADSLLKKADFRLSFSKLTFPHNIARLLLLEQIYRSMRILRNQPYHK